MPPPHSRRWIVTGAISGTIAAVAAVLLVIASNANAGDSPAPPLYRCVQVSPPITSH